MKGKYHGMRTYYTSTRTHACTHTYAHTDIYAYTHARHTHTQTPHTHMRTLAPIFAVDTKLTWGRGSDDRRIMFF